MFFLCQFVQLLLLLNLTLTFSFNLNAYISLHYVIHMLKLSVVLTTLSIICCCKVPITKDESTLFSLKFIKQDTFLLQLC